MKSETCESASLKLATKDEYATRLQVSTRSVDRLMSLGLPHIKLGHRTVRINTYSADAWLTKRFGARSA